MALHNCDEVAVAGFGYDMNTPHAPLHYYETVKMSAIKEVSERPGGRLGGLSRQPAGETTEGRRCRSSALLGTSLSSASSWRRELCAGGAGVLGAASPPIRQPPRSVFTANQRCHPRADTCKP